MRETLEYGRPSHFWRVLRIEMINKNIFLFGFLCLNIFPHWPMGNGRRQITDQVDNVLLLSLKCDYMVRAVRLKDTSQFVYCRQNKNVSDADRSEVQKLKFSRPTLMSTDQQNMCFDYVPQRFVHKQNYYFMKRYDLARTPESSWLQVLGENKKIARLTLLSNICRSYRMYNVRVVFGRNWRNE